jgi:hypothetical protein
MIRNIIRLIANSLRSAIARVVACCSERSPSDRTGEAAASGFLRSLTRSLRSQTAAHLKLAFADNAQVGLQYRQFP